jgi:cytochrome c oxidase cbb3-type subunit 1
MEVVRWLKPYRLARALGGTLFLSGFILMVYNLIKTIRTAGSGFVAADLREKAN